MQKTVLIVEDSPVVANLLEAIVRREALDSLVADSIGAAKEYLRGRHGMNGLIVDLDLSDATSWHVLRQVLDDPDLNRIPRVALTSRAIPKEDMPRVSNAMSACVDKHEFDLNELREVIGRLFVSGRGGS